MTRRLRDRWGVAVLGLLAALALVLPGRAQETTAAFPDAAQVVVDYPNDVERYVALNTLWDGLHAKAPSAPEAIAKRATYYNAATAIRQRYLSTDTGFDEKVREINTPAFERSVLDRYHVRGMAGDGTRPVFRQNGGDVTDAMIKGATVIAAPIVLGALVIMYALCYVMMRGTSAARIVPAPLPVALPGLPELPESLRVVRVPGLTYTVGTASGLVVDKQTVVHTRTVTSTSPTEVHAMAGQVYTTGGQTTTSTTSTQVDTVWIRTPDGREAAWTFTASPLQTRPGHLISVVVRPKPDGSGAFLLAFNHTTGQLVDIPDNVHGTGGCLAWLVAFVIGTVAFGAAVAVYLSLERDQSTLDARFLPIVCLIMGGIGAVVAATVVMLLASRRIVGRRRAAFQRYYRPAYTDFFQQLTPHLQRHFAG